MSRDHRAPRRAGCDAEERCDCRRWSGSKSWGATAFVGIAFVAVVSMYETSYGVVDSETRALGSNHPDASGIV